MTDITVVVQPPAPIQVDVTPSPPIEVDVTVPGPQGPQGAPGVPLADLLADPGTPATAAMWFRGDLGEIRYWDGAAAQIIPRLFVGPTPPSAPRVNDLWVDTT